MLVSDLYTGITDLLMGRTVPAPKLAEAIRKSALEFSEDYPFSELEVTGPTVQFIANQPNYDTSYFQTPVIAGPPPPAIKLEKVRSFFIYSDPTIAPSTTSLSTSNSGYNITYWSIDRLETLINTPGQPVHWSRYNQQLWFGSCPDKAYYTYCRYQQEHPFPSAGLVTAGADPLMFPRTWQEILEYASAMRLAPDYNLSTKATELRQRLHGDNEFQRTDGISGSPGLIFKRTSDMERDQTTTVRRFRLRMRSN